MFGFAALYLMINPTKASYSVAPTMMVCALAGYLTAKLFADAPRHRLLLIALVGLLIGLSVNFRLPNLLLSAGYCLYLAGAFLLARNRETFLQGVAFGVAFLIGMAPTLIANAINAGSPFATTYGADDVVPPGLNAGVLLSYLEGRAIHLAGDRGRWTAWLWRSIRGSRQVAARRRHQSGGEPDLLHDPSDLHALLHHPDRHALALDPAVCDAGFARPSCWFCPAPD